LIKKNALKRELINNKEKFLLAHLIKHIKFTTIFKKLFKNLRLIDSFIDIEFHK